MTDELLADVQAMFNALVADNRLIKEEDRFVLVMSPEAHAALTDTARIKQHFPNIDVVTAAQYIEPERKGLAPTGQRKEEERKAKAREIVAKMHEARKTA